MDDLTSLRYKTSALSNLAATCEKLSKDSAEYFENVAYVIASIAHADQLDKLGKPYINHILDVTQGVRQSCPEAVPVALLHDAIDDCPAVTVGLLEKVGFDATTIKALTLLRRPSGMSVRQSLRKILETPLDEKARQLAVEVKQSDLTSNTRLPASPTQKDLDRSEFYQMQLRWFRQQL